MSDINSAFSANLTVGQKAAFENVMTNISSGISTISNAASSLFGKLPSLKISTSFEPKDFAKVNKASAAKTPEVAKSQAPSYKGVLTYPAGMQYYTMFSFKEYKKKNVTDVAQDKSSVTIVLPLPANMSETFGVEYSTPTLGPVVGAAAEGIIEGARKAGASGVVEAVGKGMANIPEGIEAAGLNKLKSMSGTGETAAAIGSMALGVAPNPHMAVIFSNMGLRSHRFSYKFAPRSKEELGTLKAILYHLKHKMLPGLDKNGGMLFSFPDVVDIKFVTGRGKAPYIIKRCVMESLDINYSPGGSPAFFKTGDPVMVEVTMSFKEMSPYTRDDVIETKPPGVD